MFGIATSLLNNAFEWAEVERLRVVERGQDEDKYQSYEVDGSLEDVVNELATAIVVLYLKFQGHRDAREITEEAARLMMGGSGGEV